MAYVLWRMLHKKYHSRIKLDTNNDSRMDISSTKSEDNEEADIRKADVKRSKSKVRTYLKKYKDRLTGHQSHNEYCTADCFHEPHEPISIEATSSWYIDVVEPATQVEVVQVDKDDVHKIIDTQTLMTLLENYISHLYTNFHSHTKHILFREALDVLIYGYHGCLEKFENHYLKPFAKVVSEIYENHIQTQDLVWPKGWPLTTETGDVILHIGTIDESFVHFYDAYICVKPAITSTPEVCIFWRNPNNSNIECRLIDLDNGKKLSPILLEMLTDDLPQLLQNLLVGVERAIGRIPINNLSFPIQTKTSGRGAASTATATITADNGNVLNAINANDILVSGEDEDEDVNSNSTSKIVIKSGLETNTKITLSYSPKCALKRSEQITKNNFLNNKYILRKYSTKLDGGSQPSTPTMEDPSSKHPLFCLGNTFPHIDSDEENSSDDQRRISIDSGTEVMAPRSIVELPEKLLTSGLCLPGIRDLNGRSIVTVDGSLMIESAINCYETASVLLYYSTIPESSSSSKSTVPPCKTEFTILVNIRKMEDDTPSLLNLLSNSLKLITNNLRVNDILVYHTFEGSVVECNNNLFPNITVREITNKQSLTTYISLKNAPKEFGGDYLHNQEKWIEFMQLAEVIQNQCISTGQRLVATMSDIRLSDLQGLPTRRQLYAQHRALSRTLMDSDLHNLRKNGPNSVTRLNELSKSITTTATSSSSISGDATVTTTATTTSTAAATATSATYSENDVIARLNTIVILFNEVDRAAKRLEQLTEQRRERLRELTRQRNLEDEINEVTFWIQREGDEMLKCFLNTQLDDAESLRIQEQEFEKYYFVSMKHLAKGRDLYDDSLEIEAVRPCAQKLNECLNSFADKLESTREKIEGAARLHHLVDLNLKDTDVQMEIHKLAEKIGALSVLEKIKNRHNERKQKPTNFIIPFASCTSPQESKSHPTPTECSCWRDEQTSKSNEDEEEEKESKMADSGLGGCDRCEGVQEKLSRVCSCQSFDESGNLCDKSDEMDEDFEVQNKQFMDLHSPIEANAHLQYHASTFELPKMYELSNLDTKIQKQLLLIMREMITTERDYVRSLYYVIENYVRELVNRDDIPQPLRGQRNVIFGNIEKIFEFHQPHFLAELERYENFPLKVGATFLQMESKFYLYALYNKNKPKSDTLMSEYGTSFFKAKQLELGDKMDLASYLLKPVQRMGKYALLLQQLVKACSAITGPAYQELAADVEELQKAEEMVKFQLRHGNDLLAMDSLRDCDVNVKEQGRLLRQNEFLVWQGRGGKKSLRQVFLFEELVLFSKARRFPDRKNLDIYIYKNSIKTSDIGLTAHSDSPTKFEIWFRKRKPDDTWTMQSISEDVKIAWTDEISTLLWKQAKKNREIRLAEMSSMGIGSKPCLDIRPSNNQISDRSVTISQIGKTPKLRHSFACNAQEITKSSKRPNSLISDSSVSSSTSSSSISTGSSNGSSKNRCGLELINEKSTLNVNNKRNQRSTTLVSQLSMESGILSDISMTPDTELHEPHWPTIRKTESSTLSTILNPSHRPDECLIHQQQRTEIALAEQEDPYISDSVTVHL
ncbi:PLEKHG4 family protein [Megaselia abdita]